MMSALSLLTLKYSQKLLLPFQLAVDLAHHIDQALAKNVTVEILNPLVKNHAGEMFEYWIDYDGMGDVAKIKALKIFECFINETNLFSSPITVTFDISKAELSSDNLALIDLFEAHLAHLFCFHFEEKVQQTVSFKLYTDCLTRYHDFHSLIKTSIPSEVHLEKDSTFISNYAWLLTHYDAIDLAKHIFNLAYNRVKDINIKMSYLNALQSTRIGLQHYKEAMEQAVPNNLKDTDLQAYLWYSKAYSSVLMRNIKMAKKYFDLLKIDETLEVSSIQALYKLNIYALFLFQKGDKEKAYQLELKMRECLAHFENKNTLYIHYINSLNISRLYRYQKDYQRSKYYYDDAYNTITGFKTHSDHIYHNLSDALTFEGLGEHRKALHSMLRAALFWESMPCPSALAWRPRATLLGKKFSFTKPLDPFEINDYFISKLSFFLEQLDISLNKSDKKVTFINDASKAKEKNSLQYHATEQLSFLLSKEKVNRIAFSHQNGELNTFLVDIIQAITVTELASSSTIIIDENGGYGIALDESSVFCRTFMLGLKNYYFNSKLKEVSPSLIGKLTIKLSPMTYKLAQEGEKYKVYFKRFYAPTLLEPKLAKILASNKKIFLKNLLSNFDINELILLAEKNVLYFEIDPVYLNSKESSLQNI